MVKNVVAKKTDSRQDVQSIDHREKPYFNHDYRGTIRLQTPVVEQICSTMLIYELCDKSQL